MKVGVLNMHQHMIPLFCMFLLLPSCAHKSRLIKKKIVTSPHAKQPAAEQHDQPALTVLIHGTKLVIRSSYYTHFNGEPDLKHVSAFISDEKMHESFTTLAASGSDMFEYDHLYFFGWSGKLRVKERDQAAEILYDKLISLSKAYFKQYGIKPAIRLVCHSHGGNLALTLARIHAQKQADITIDSLIVLACPVQLSTKDFADYPLFKQVYAFYSMFDFVQVIAPEIAHYIHNDKGELVDKKRCWFPFSARCFDRQSRVKQARITMNNHAVLHSAFTTIDFLRVLPDIIRTVDEVYAQHERAITQDHKEILCAIQRPAYGKYV